MYQDESEIEDRKICCCFIVVISTLILLGGSAMIIIGIFIITNSPPEYSQTDLYYFQGMGLNATILSYPAQQSTIEELMFNNYAANPILIDDQNNYCVLFYQHISIKDIESGDKASFSIKTTDQVKFKHEGKYVYDCYLETFKTRGNMILFMTFGSILLVLGIVILTVCINDIRKLK